MNLKKIDPSVYQPRSLVLNVILDGVGIAPHSVSDAFKAAHTPVLDRLREECLYRTLFAHGTYVGLPSDQEMGNSEVGHNALGSGQIYPQGAKLINQSVANGEIIETQVWKNLIEFSKQHRSTIHFVGLLSDGYVHSHIDHLKYLILQAAKFGIKQIFLHAILDGRDVAPHSSLQYVKEILNYFEEIEKEYDTRCHIASVGGRMVVVMDRYEADWQMVERGWDLIVEGKAERKFEDPLEGIKQIKEEKNFSDQYLEPFIVVKKGENSEALGPIYDGDGVVLFNYRGDRAIEICRAFEEKHLNTIKRDRFPKIFFVGMMQYDGDLGIPKNYLVHPCQIRETMGEYLVKNNIPLFAISETQKYGHVTYFWNGNRSGKFSESLEKYVEIKSDIIPFEERPWMKSAEITDRVIDLIRSKNFSFGRINYPNGDMVGHSGSFHAARMSMEAVDLSLGRLLKAVDEVGGVAIILADHGNCDEMMEIDASGNLKKDENRNNVVKTSHTLNPVPCIIYDSTKTKKNLEYDWKSNDLAGLANVAATTFNLMGYEAPTHYQPSLIEWKNDRSKIKK